MKGKSTQPASQSKISVGGSGQNFSNPNYYNRSRTHNVSPNNMLSPPPGMASGSMIAKLNLDQNKNKFNEESANNKQRNL